MPKTSNRPQILIIGGGVIGLSTAVALQDHPILPCDVTILAKDLPSSDSSVYSAGTSHAAPASYASAWAGAHHISDAKDIKQLEMDKVTFRTMKQLQSKWKLGIQNNALIDVHQVEYFASTDHLNESSLSWYPKYRHLPSSALPDGVSFGCTFETLDINVPQYLPRLHELFISLGGHSVCANIKSVSGGVEIFSREKGKKIKPQAVIVSPGLGALELLGDTSVHPVRGQTVLIRAPWCTAEHNGDAAWINSPHETDVTNTLKWVGMSKVNNQGFRDMYLIPRGDGTIIVGGTRLVNDADIEPRQATTDEIVERALQYMPGLAIPSSPQDDEDEKRGKVDIIGVNVGMRPARSKGVRLDRGESVDGIPIIYSYGYGGFGYQCSWGAAFKARDLVDDALQRDRAPPQSTLALLAK